MNNIDWICKLLEIKGQREDESRQQFLSRASKSAYDMGHYVESQEILHDARFDGDNPQETLQGLRGLAKAMLDGLPGEPVVSDAVGEHLEREKALEDMTNEELIAYTLLFGR